MMATFEIETPRLIVRRFTLDDAAFVVRLLNEPAFLQYIGDRGVRSLEDGREYLLNGPMESYRLYGYGLYAVEVKTSGAPIGMCGLVKRASLTNADLGFAFLAEVGSQGYAYEAASGVMRHSQEVVGLKRVLAITSLTNGSSMRLLAKLGFRFERRARLAAGAEELNLFAVAL